MQKKNVLGSDPLRWLKEKDKKKESESTKNKIDAQEKIEDKILEPKEVNKISAESKIQEAKPYKSVDVSGTSKLQEEKAYKPSDVTEVHRRKILGEEAYPYNARTREVTQKEGPATMFVIVYTVLLLILGFIVYRDLTKQIDTLNTKLTNLEKQVDAGKINYEDTKVNDVW